MISGVLTPTIGSENESKIWSKCHLANLSFLQLMKMDSHWYNLNISLVKTATYRLQFIIILGRPPLSSLYILIKQNMEISSHLRWEITPHVVCDHVANYSTPEGGHLWHTSTTTTNDGWPQLSQRNTSCLGHITGKTKSMGTNKNGVMCKEADSLLHI